MTVPLPAATDSPQVLADWLEYQALVSEDRQSSLEALVRVLRRGGTADELPGLGDHAGVEASQLVAHDAFKEIEARIQACGNSEFVYPFTVDRGAISVEQPQSTSPYMFLLLLSYTTPTSGHLGTAALFEQFCANAAHHYIGGAENRAQALRFGSPRRPPLALLNQAVDDLCLKLGEGAGCGSPELADHSGDEGLDIVAWRNFPDGRPGKLIAFGQCAAGRGSWADKLAELDGIRFTRKWFRQLPLVLPVRLFFIPWRLERDEWEHSGIDAGIVFDRCRIVACLRQLPDELRDACARAIPRLLQRP